MIKAVSLPARQIALVVKAQAIANKAQGDLDLVVQTVLAGLDVEGQVVSVDGEKGVLNIEVADVVEDQRTPL